MTVLKQTAHSLGRRDEAPNEQLAKQLAARKDRAGIRELAENLNNADPALRADCLKVLYEVGYLDPELVAPYVEDFLALLASRNNRLVWGAMIALSTIAALEPKRLYARRAVVQEAMRTGSVITIDNGVKVLAAVAAQAGAYRRELFPFLLGHLRTCRPKDVPQHAASILAAVNASNKAAFIEVVEARAQGQPASRVARIRRVAQEAGRR
jgi:hypothetical protein